MKTIQILLKKESALKHLYSNTFKNIQNDINNICREIFEQKLKVINVIKSGENPNITINYELVENNKTSGSKSSGSASNISKTAEKKTTSATASNSGVEKDI